MMIRTIYWENNRVMMIDQKALPLEEKVIACDKYTQVIEAIRDLTVRGAPAIGVAAAMGIALGILQSKTDSPDELKAWFERICLEFSQARPTARNLFWAVERMRRCMDSAMASYVRDQKKTKSRRIPRINTQTQASLFEVMETPEDSLEGEAESWDLTIKQAMMAEAVRVGEEDIGINERMGEHGKALIRDGASILTHCNAGALATAGYGTALGIVRAAWAEGKKIHVYVDETRPVLQGARLTAWEMLREGIPATLITDNMAGFVMKQGKVDMVIVGADRIAANGDTANKIGTYSLSVLAKAHGIPFYIAAPFSTIDPSTADGSGIIIEERGPGEVTGIGGTRTAPEGISVYNPAFDVTPHELITAIITEAGIIEPPFAQNIAALVNE